MPGDEIVAGAFTTEMGRRLMAEEVEMTEETTTPDTTETAEATATGETTTTEEAAPSLADDLTLGGGAPADADAAPAAAASQVRGKVDRFGVAMGTGRRKSSVARVRIKDGSGKFVINGREADVYFRLERDRQSILAPLRATETLGDVDVWVRVNGGGTTGQAGAIVLGVARALQVRDPALHHTLSTGGYLTRDSRMVERKKYGLRKARRSFQFSKR